MAGTGGGLYFLGFSSPKLFSCLIDSNSVAGGGGGITLEIDAAAVIESCTVTRNNANEGGGFYFTGVAPTILASVIEGNHANQGGGAKLMYTQGPEFLDCDFRSNGAEFSGGGLNSDHSSFTMEGCRIDSNSSGTAGGAVWLQDSNAILGHCRIRDNSAVAQAGGLLVRSSILKATDGEISGNGEGVIVSVPGTADAIAANNWWGDSSGPYHPTGNPAGLGDAVSDHVVYFPWESSTGVNGEPNLPAPLLLVNRPNPFNAVTSLRFDLTEPGFVSLAIHDLSGRKIAGLSRGHHRAGEWAVRWNGRDDAGREIPSGVYFARLVSGERR